MLPVMNFVGGMYFSLAFGKISLAMIAWDSSRRKPSSVDGSISNACPRPICSSGMFASISKLFVDELGGGYGVSGFDGVVCGQVVVFARVKDDAAVSVITLDINWSTRVLCILMSLNRIP